MMTDLALFFLARVALTLSYYILLVHSTVILVHEIHYCMILEVTFFLLLSRFFFDAMTVMIF